MNNKVFVIAVILATFMAFAMISVAFAGPKASQMEIHIYDNPDTENQDLQSKVLNINDWPLTKTWIDAWALMPATVTLDSYTELGMYEIDINNQMWPTGDSVYKFYEDGIAGAQANRSLAFRQAVAFLMDRDAVITQILKGYGIKMTVPLPPFQDAYADMSRYKNANETYKIGAVTYQLNSTVTTGITYPYYPAMADYILTQAGFTLLPGHTYRTDPLTGNDLTPIIFYIRQDDPSRLQMGQLLASALKAHGIPVNVIVTEKTVCYKNVMVVYNYHLYTGGWSLSVIPNQYHDLYASETYYGPSVGWSNNYPGFCNRAFDDMASKVAYPADKTEAIQACKDAGYLFLKYCAIVPVYCNKAVKAYVTGSTGVVNNAAGGVDNYYTFLNGNTTTGKWDYGFKSNIEQLNQISSQWLWDQNCLGLQYESLMGTNPFSLELTEYWIASASESGKWDATGTTYLAPNGSYVNGDVNATWVKFTIRDNIYWHNGTLPQTVKLTPQDVNFSFYFTQACGPSVAWNYPSVKMFYNSTIVGQNITLFYKVKSYWTLLQAGGLPILREALWGPLWTSSAFPGCVRTYDPSTGDNNNNGVIDMKEDGTGAWIFSSYTPNEWVYLTANDNYYLNQTYIAGRLQEMFWSGAGDVNLDGVVNAQDLGYMARAMFTNSTGGYTIGTDWGDWNYRCDLNTDGKVNGTDLVALTTNYGLTMG